MVNSEQFATRLQKILEFYDISAATFAEAIEVGRSSISHILSGRNKPSLDFVMKVVQTYPEVELYWLLNGKGSFPPSDKKGDTPIVEEKKGNEPGINAPQHNLDLNKSQEISESKYLKGEKRIKKIVLLYEDGSFEAFENGILV